MCFPDKKQGAKQIASVLNHFNARQALRWLNGKRGKPWEIRQVIAAMELGLILHPGAPVPEPIPYDPEIDYEPTTEEKAHRAVLSPATLPRVPETEIVACAASVADTEAFS